MNGRRILAGLIIVLAAAPALEASDRNLVEALRDCRDVLETSARVDCYDALVDDIDGDPIATPEATAGFGESATAVAEPVPSRPPTGSVDPNPQSLPSPAANPRAGPHSGGGATPAITATQPDEVSVSGEDLFGKDRSSGRRLIEDVFGVLEVDTLEATAARVEKTPYGKLMLLLDNGQVWTQLDSSRLTIRPGDGVRIESASSGSFLLEKQSGSRKIRVKRVD